MQENKLKLLIKKISRIITKSNDVNKTTFYLMNKHFNIKLNSKYNSHMFVFNITINNFRYVNDYDIDIVRFKNELVQNDLNSTEGIYEIIKFKTNYKYYMDKVGNQYYKNIVNNKFEFSSNLIEKFNESDITNSMLHHPSICYLYNNGNMYFLTNDVDMCYEDEDDNKREDIKITHECEQYSFRKIYSIDSKYSIKGKDWIKYYLFNKNEFGKLYFLKMSYKDIIFYKVGITKNDIKSRYKALTKSITIIDYIQYDMNMLKASIIERFLHYKYKHLQEIPKIHFEGKTECFYNDIHNYYKNDKLIENKSIMYIASEYNLSYDIIHSILNFKEGME